MKTKVLTANLLWFLYSAVRTRTWKKAIKNVEASQAKILRQLLTNNAETSFGQKHSFSTLNSVAAFQKAVPVQSYEDVQQYIDEIASGTPNVLTSDPVQRFGVSSGSTRASKLVPYTRSLIAEFQEGIDPWMYHLMSDHSGVLGGKAYWSVTPIGERPRHSSGGIPIGFDDERSYFGKLTQWVFGTVMATPSELALVQDMDAFRYATLRFLLQESSLSWVSIWNPTFVTLFLSPLEKWFDQLIEDVRTGTLSVDLGVTPEVDASIRRNLRKSSRRAKELVQIRNGEKANLYERIWPNLKLISCWAHGNSREAVRQLRSYFPNVAIQPKGLIATEAFVSFPLRGEASALSITSHFFEFEGVEDETIRLAHELEVGKKYSVIVTTGGGLYRYRLNDVIEVLGFEAQCPLIRFVGKQDKVVDICGEKLNEQFVSDIVKPILAELSHQPTFWMMAPVQSSTVEYTLFIQFEDGSDLDGTLERMGREIDQALRENYHYDYCRRLGQLGQCRVFLVDSRQSAHEAYLNVCTELGQRLGDIKPVALHPFKDWSQKFEGKFI